MLLNILNVKSPQKPDRPVSATESDERSAIYLPGRGPSWTCPECGRGAEAPHHHWCSLA